MRPAVLLLALVFAVALGTRVIAALDYGRDWYGPGSFTHINFDEAGSCRAALGEFSYASFVGHQTLWIGRLFGLEFDPPVTPLALATADGNAARNAAENAVKAFCHSEEHLRIARLYSAVAGGLTVVLLFVLALQLFPGRYDLALGSAALLGLSGWHISESLTGTVDAASTFFIYLFLVLAISASRAGVATRTLAGAALLAAVATKYWLFAIFSVAALVPPGIYPQLFQGITRARAVVLCMAYALLFGLVSNPALPEAARWLLPLVFYLLLPWRCLSAAGRVLLGLAPWLAPIAVGVDLFVAFSAGDMSSAFGTGYGAIGWHKLPRNLLNVPIVLFVGLGFPAAVALVFGVRELARDGTLTRTWLWLLPLAVFLLYMLFLSPVTYYRHYLPLLPAACLLAALGLGRLAPAARKRAWALVLLWQAMLALDLVSDYHLDPRRSLPHWYATNGPAVVMHGYYVNPPRNNGAVHRLFREAYALGQGSRLRLADTLILSENWYDTAFANEVNGPLVHDPAKLIKTSAQAVAFHRAAVADAHPMLQQVARFRAPTFMPELLLHRAAYGSFTQFVGDLLIFRIKP